jgi:hypothetical protein
MREALYFHRSRSFERNEHDSGSERCILPSVRRDLVSDIGGFTPRRPMAKFAYDAELNAIFVELAGVPADTRAEIAAHFAGVARFWNKVAGGERAYFIVDYTNFLMNMREIEFYSQQVKRVLDLYAVTIVRFGGDALQRSSARLVSVKIHQPSNLYRTREEAIDVVRGLRTGTVKLLATQ